MRLFPVLAFGLLAQLYCASVPVAAQTATPAASPTIAVSGDFAGLVDIGSGRRLWLECRGQGSPTVVLESGAGSSAAMWDTMALGPESKATAVLPGVAAFTRVCAYDRPGTVLDADHRSRSDPVPMPRSAADAVADLHALLQAAGVPGPYVLVGHSFGGIIVRLYAATYPDEVAGLVLVEASHEEQNARYQQTLTAEQWAAFESLQQQVPPGLEDYPELEQFDFDTSFTQMREAAAAHPSPSLPMVILTHGVPLGAELPPEAQSALPADFPWDAFEAVWQELQADLAALVPNARQVIASESGHYIQLQQPQLVIDAIQQVVAAVRDPSTWATPAGPGAATPTT